MHKITLYTQPDCPPCEYSKLFLKEHGFVYECKDIQKDPRAKKELIKKYQSFSTPTFVIDGTVIYGFDLEKLKFSLNL
ncbi:glutaredoxin family protein [Niallia sp. FSL W8-0635]|uniref:glutaredoxin family protein n=1 Tax=Niallia sp. FSL W8-0635 TaxID=2975337 RepID=UPI0009D17793|nr:glutaredoxin 3 [Mycobacteroides abscessus subsp. abscessus]HEO8420775.1 glutathione S-transferase N-terminal domain-containing protein [Yersinia enterocolitica]